ncbi:phenylalanine--tRNA ligase subunit alpha [Candidatus Aerophobetes bacterium]|uniref:Phenylalanine--tRNA ligase alpha subunit n=1 Tax=Aerophobetes bacterium TaxID=2030807 RepID=A0A2A4YDH5_UNCAE|nr:MAG: phenylalanine--tRNA ligase subunit alpha [Candidatus Aerophobetes bacterium]
MKEKISQLNESFTKELDEASSSDQIQNLKIKYLGKKGPIQALMPLLKDCTSDERPLVGKMINELKQDISSKVENRLQTLLRREQNDRISSENEDVTLPGRKRYLGKEHPISSMMQQVLDILIQMGFSVQTTPEIESEYYNYGGLNYPEDHPARDMQDTFYLTKDLLLRSHTTSIQQRIMEKHTPPIRIVSYGKCYRNETITTRSHVLFHQVDGLYIDKNVTFADLLATKKEFYSKIFEKDVKVRVRPSYFPFVEPGLEIDISCTSCDGKGCRLCKTTGWLEVCGAGMVHPEVLKQGGLDPEVYSGYAWGGGIERLVMLKYGITDIRMFTENDARFLGQFA